MCFFFPGCGLCLKCCPPATNRIPPAAFEGSDGRGAVQSDMKDAGTHMRRTLGGETEHEEIPAVHSHAERLTVVDRFHMAASLSLRRVPSSYEQTGSESEETQSEESASADLSMLVKLFPTQIGYDSFLTEEVLVVRFRFPPTLKDA